MPFEKELEVARRIAEQAGRLALENHARGFESETKPDDSPVTSADRANERLITKLLEEAFPDDGLLGEEGASREARSGRRWIIDPIDGTRSFMRGIPTWGVMLALEAEGEVVVGACNLAAAGGTLFRRGRTGRLLQRQAHPLLGGENAGPGDALPDGLRQRREAQLG